MWHVADEVIYKSNQDEFKSWHLPGSTALRPKSEGAGLMIAGFRTWESGWLSITLAEKTLLEVELGRPFKHFFHYSEEKGGDGNYYSYHQFNYGKNREGYWDGDKMVHMVDEVLLVARLRHPGHELRFLFDWSSCHDKMPLSAFNVKKFGVEEGYQYTREGVQKPFLVDDLELECDYPDRPAGVEFAGEGFGVQHVCFQPRERPHFGAASTQCAGLPKGLRQLLWERGLWKDGMTRVGGKEKTLELSMEHILNLQPDVEHQKSSLHLAIEAAGHVCVMLPKFHCEMNGIERVWGRSKWYTRRFCNYTYPSLERTVPRSLSADVISPQLHRRFARKARDYMRGYASDLDSDAKSCAVLVAAAKVKRLQHRSTPPSESNPDARKFKPWEKKKLELKAAQLRAENNAGAFSRVRAL